MPLHSSLGDRVRLCLKKNKSILKILEATRQLNMGISTYKLHRDKSALKIQSAKSLGFEGEDTCYKAQVLKKVQIPGLDPQKFSSVFLR